MQHNVYLAQYEEHNTFFLATQPYIERVICMAYSLKNKLQVLIQPARKKYRIHLYADYSETLCQWSTEGRHRIMSLREYIRTGSNKRDVCRNCLRAL